MNQRPFKWGIRGFRELIPNNFSAFGNIFRALKHRNFLLYFCGQLVSLIGSWIQQVAMGWLVFRLTDSLYMLSWAVFLSQAPILFFTSFAGVVVDRFDRRKILIYTQTLLLFQSMVLGILTIFGLITVPIIFCLCLFFGIVVSFDAPARQSFYSKIVPAEDLSNAIALNSTTINLTRFLGPAVGGVLISAVGEGYCFLINSITFLAILWSLSAMRLKKFIATESKSSALKEMVDGFSYAIEFLPIRAIFLLLFVISFFGLPFQALLPAFTKNILNGDSEVLGNLMSCVGIGSVIAALYLAARRSVLGLGKIVTFSTILFGVSLMLVSVVKENIFAYILCVPLGFGFIASAASCNTLLQTLVKESLRGRIMSIFTMILFGMVPLGSLLEGFLSTYFSFSNITIFCGGICVFSGFLFEYFRPTIRKHAHSVYVEKGIVIDEIAKGLQSLSKKPFSF